MRPLRDLRRLCHLLARTLGDVIAVGSGRLLPRAWNKLVGRLIVWRFWRR